MFSHLKLMMMMLQGGWMNLESSVVLMEIEVGQLDFKQDFGNQGISSPFQMVHIS